VPIHFRCPHCDKLLAIGTRQGGTQIHCPMCDRVITVPPRTQVQVPTTTVVLPDVSQAWWLDAPPVLPPNLEPPPPAEAWWLTAHEPPASTENAITTAPPIVPPPLPEAIAPSPDSEPSPNPLVFEPSPQAPPVANEKTSPVKKPRPFPRKSVYLLAGVAVAAIVLVAVIIAWILVTDTAPQHPIDAPAGTENREGDKTTASLDAEPSRPAATSKPSSPGSIAAKHRREKTEEELRREAAQFPEVSLDLDDDRTEAQRVRQLADTAAREGTPWDFGAQIIKQRPDLAGLPLRKSDENRLDAKAADRLQSSALALRAALFEAAGGDTEADADKLRSLLDADDAPRDKWLRSESIPALQQLLMGEAASLREVLVERLAKIDGPRASVALARSALFDLHADVRRRAVAALAKRERRDYQQVLLDGFAYPWPAVADHAAEALVALEMRESVPALLKLLDQPNPASAYKKVSKDALYVREVVRINHLHNCLLCHAPSLKESDKLRGFVPVIGKPLPPPYTREYYGPRRPGQFVRADVTYFQQDFSVPLPVEKHGRWPGTQRYDFLVRERPIPPAAANRENEPPQALFFALRELTGTDAGSTVEDWKRWAQLHPR
jgi:phage FluMu protein Com